MTVDSVALHVSLSWLSEATVKVRNIVGDALWEKIVDAVGGSTLYIPVESSYYHRRRREILLFAGNHTVHETAERFGLSVRHVRRILSG